MVPFTRFYVSVLNHVEPSFEVRVVFDHLLSDAFGERGERARIFIDRAIRAAIGIEMDNETRADLQRRKDEQ